MSAPLGVTDAGRRRRSLCLRCRGTARRRRFRCHRSSRRGSPRCDRRRTRGSRLFHARGCEDRGGERRGEARSTDDVPALRRARGDVRDVDVETGRRVRVDRGEIRNRAALCSQCLFGRTASRRTLLQPLLPPLAPVFDPQMRSAQPRVLLDFTRAVPPTAKTPGTSAGKAAPLRLPVLFGVTA